MPALWAAVGYSHHKSHLRIRVLSFCTLFVVTSSSQVTLHPTWVTGSGPATPTHESDVTILASDRLHRTSRIFTPRPQTSLGANKQSLHLATSHLRKPGEICGLVYVEGTVRADGDC